jgi:hypothetical protein
VKRVRAATALGTGQPLAFTTRTGIIESLLPDPDGEVTVAVPPEAIDDLATVIALDIATDIAPA